MRTPSLIVRLSRWILASSKLNHYLCDHSGEFEKCKIPICSDNLKRARNLIAEVKELQKKAKKAAK